MRKEAIRLLGKSLPLTHNDQKDKGKYVMIFFLLQRKYLLQTLLLEKENGRRGRRNGEGDYLIHHNRESIIDSLHI